MTISDAGRLLVADRAVGRDDQLLVDGDAGQRPRLGPGGEDHRPLASSVRRCRLPAHLDRVRAPLSVPAPENRVILFLRKRNSTPLAMRSATRRDALHRLRVVGLALAHA